MSREDDKPLRRRAGTGLLIGLCLLTGGWAPSAPQESPPPASDDRDRFSRLADDYLEWYFRSHPVRSTLLGVHRYDGLLPDMSRSGVDTKIAESRVWLERLVEIDRASLDPESGFDHRILDHAIRAELLELEEIRGWRHNPLVYSRLVADAVASVVENPSAPLAERIWPLIERLHGLSALTDAARENLESAPTLWTELAILGIRATARYVDSDLDERLDAQGLGKLAPKARRAWMHSKRRAVAELDRFAFWLEYGLAQDDADFRLGRDLFERKLRYEEHVSLTAEELRAINDGAVRYYRSWLTRVAATVDPHDSPGGVMGRVGADHPQADQLIEAAAAGIERARRFVADNQLVSLPPGALPIVRATPKLARGAFASMSAPGPFEARSADAFYNITNIDPAWSARQQSEHLTYFNFPSLLGIAIHEVMPGHFVHLALRRELPSDVRKVFLPASVIEGWAHYAEQMMVDEGLGADDPTVRLAQLRRALQRHARWDAGLGIHAFGMPVDRAVERFQRIAYFPEFPATREIQRATYDPTYLYYALGRMQILELREDYRSYLEARGREFSLRDFHDRFLRMGLPISLAREALMPDVYPSSAHSGSAATPRPSAKRS